jgi:repressor LexA
MTSEHFLEVLEARRRQAALQKASARQHRSDSFEGSRANKLINMSRPDHAVPRGSIVGVVWAGDPDSDPVMEGTPTEDLLDEFGVGPNDYFLRVRGSSMNDAGIEEGDLVQVRPVKLGTAPPDGAIVLAEVDVSQAIGERSGRTTVKRFFRQGEKIRLQPANSGLNPKDYQSDDVIVMGIIVNIIRQFTPL